jgi:hypothetical protein
VVVVVVDSDSDRKKERLGLLTDNLLDKMEVDILLNEEDKASHSVVVVMYNHNQ